MRRPLWAGSVIAIVVALNGVVLSPANAFPPSPWLALGYSSHASITDDVITRLDREFFAVADTSRTMRKAIEEIVDANKAVDDDQFQSAKHFDGENFAGGQNRVVELRAQVIAGVQADDASSARIALGSALHGIQDFYSHSNWVELGNRGPSSDLGRPGRALGPVAGAGEATCDGSRLITRNLTSGYYHGEDRDPDKAVRGKCRHGGPFDSGSRLNGISKDSPIGPLAPHAPFHTAAKAVADAATEQFLRDIKGEITPRQLRLLLGAGPTLAMAIDTTGSMSGAIAGVRAEATEIVDSRLGEDDEPAKYVLSPFNDPSTGPVRATTDPDEFKSGLSGLGASGGGDCPELAMTGTLNALAQTDEGGTLFLFTDASAKDSGLAGAVSGVASSKEIAVYPILFGSCSPIDPAYIRLASDSGGQVFELSQDDADSVTELAGRLTRSDSVRVLSVSGVADNAPQSWDIPVDSGLTDLTVAASGASTVELHRPDGTLAVAGDPDVSLTTLGSGSTQVTLATVAAPQVGLWTATLASDGSPFSLNVFGRSALDLSSFDLLTEVTGHEGTDYRRLAGQPLSGSAESAGATVTGEPRSVAFDLRSPGGDVIATPTLSPLATDGAYFGPLPVPSQPFRPVLTGTDATGAVFQRVAAGVVRPQSVVVTAPARTDLVPGIPVTLTFTVENRGEPGNFTVSAADDTGFITASAPSAIDLPTGGRASVEVAVLPPADTEVGRSQTLTVDVARADDVSQHNYAVLVNPVVAAPQLPPTAVAGPDRTVETGATVTLDGTGSSDPESDPLTMRWSVVSSPTPVSLDASAPVQDVVLPNAGAYVFALTVDDGRGGSSTDEVTYTAADAAPAPPAPTATPTPTPAPSASADSPATPGPSAPPPANPGEHSGSLSNTGTDPTVPVAVGLALVVLGAVLLLLRARKVPRQPGDRHG